MHFVLPLSEFETKEGRAFAVMSLNEQSDFEMQVGESWADAARLLVERLSGPVTCDPALTAIAARRGWAVGAPSADVLEARATVSLSLASGFPPDWRVPTSAFIEAWRRFWPMRLWEQMPPELSLPILRRTKGKERTHAVSFLGQSELEYGVAFYEDFAAFDALWSGASTAVTGYSVLAADEDDPLALAFDPLGVPAPVLACMKSMRPRKATRRDLVEATAVMQLLFGITQGNVEPIEVGPGETLELKRTPKAPAKKKKARKG